MALRLRQVGIVLAALGLIFMVAAGIAYSKVQEGYDSLQAFSEAQNVTLSYDEHGELIDRGTTDGAEAILAMLQEDWGYPVVESDLDPDDPLINTATEYMYQMATIGYHVLHGTQTVTLTEDVEYEGTVYPAGTYEFDVDGRYWTDFDREHPIEGIARGQAWSGIAHGLIAELGVGTLTHTALQMGLTLAAIFAGMGVLGLAGGIGLFWAGRIKQQETLDTPNASPAAFSAKKRAEDLVMSK